MIFGNSNELAQFVDSLLALEPDQALRLLEEEDQKQLSYANNTMIHKMPKELQPQNTRSASPLHTADTTPIFPSMFDGINKKTYEYINEDIENMKKIATGYNSHIRSPVIPTQTVKQMENLQKEPLIVEPQPIREDEAASKSHKENKSGHSLPSMHSSIRPSSTGKLAVSKNPFVPNSINFTDKYANSKVLQQKYQHLSFSESARNLAAMAQTAKHSAFNQSVAFPTTVLTGNMMPPSDQTFSRQTKLDVDDVMRYTLGVKRERTEKTPLQNPFVRVPKRRE